MVFAHTKLSATTTKLTATTTKLDEAAVDAMDFDQKRHACKDAGGVAPFLKMHGLGQYLAHPQVQGLSCDGLGVVWEWFGNLSGMAWV